MLDDLGVPCPSCGSLLVLVGPQAAARPEPPSNAPARGHVPRVRDCSCRECSYSFRHDFAFSR